jgi:hypothetical protein
MRDFLAFTSHPKWRSAILFAALSFAVFHVVAVTIPPVSIEMQLIHLGAVLLRFVLPCACFTTGMLAYLGRHKAKL